MEKVIMVFIDGLGIGEPDPARNPVRSVFTDISPDLILDNRAFPESFPGGRTARLDACLGVEGIPQSATGQTSLYTGVNAQAHLGYHLNAFPNKKLIDLIMEESLPLVLRKEGLRSVNGNLHTPGFFKNRRGGIKNRFPVSTLMTFAGRSSFLFKRDYSRGSGVFMDITGRHLKDLGLSLPLLSPSQAAEQLISLTDRADFIYYEYFLTDRWGHKRKREKLEECLADLIPFLGELSRRVKERGSHLIITSDHGNAEDFSTGDHTRNPVPLVYIPPGGNDLYNTESLPSDLTEVYDMILHIFRIEK